MKKFFAFVAAALVAFSFASCNKNDGPSAGGFDITVGEVTYNAAQVTVTPTDTAAAYFFSYVSTDDLAYNEMTIEEYAADDMEWYPEQGYTFAELARYGAMTFNITSLTAETEYYVYAFAFNDKFEILSDVVYRKFTTPKIEIVGEETLNLSDAQYAWAYYADHSMGLLQIFGVDVAKDSLIFSTALYTGEQAAGTYTEEDMYEPYVAYGYTNYYNYLYNEELDLSFETLTLAASVNADSTLNFSGSVVADNATKYNFSAVATKYVAEEGEEEAAPAAAPKKVAKKAVKKLPAKRIARK